MRTLYETPEDFDVANAACAKLVADLIGGFKPSEANKLILAGEDLLAGGSKGKFYLLREGNVPYIRNGKILFYFEEGDLIGLENHFQGANVSSKIEFAVKVDEYNSQDVFTRLGASPELMGQWIEYFCTQLSMFSSLVASLVKDAAAFQPNIRTYHKGQTIIEQGADAPEVFNMLEGRADVLVDGVKVGEILPDEIFGALAALTKGKRTATVIATDECMVLVLAKENFLELIESRPHTILKMVEDMARAIVALNSQVVEFSRKKTQIEKA